jgi:hypothetical protein
MALTASSASLTVPENSLATAIGIAAPTDTNFSASALVITVTALPSNGTVVLADGITPVSLGQRLTVLQLTELKFRPTLNRFGDTSSFLFSVSDPAGETANASAALTIGPNTTPLLTHWTSLSVPENSGAMAINIAAPVDVNFASSALTVTITGLPTNGTVFLANGTTSVAVGNTLTVAQLTGLVFKPTGGVVERISTLSYDVSDPAGTSVNGSALLAVHPATAPVAIQAHLTVAANSGATPIGIAAPTDDDFTSSG